MTCFNSAGSINEIDPSSAYYITGYVCHKENLLSTSDDFQPTQSACPESEFLDQLSRGN